MNLEQIIQAKQDYYIADALISLGFGAVLLLAGAIMAHRAYLILKKDLDSAPGIVYAILALIVLPFGFILVPISVQEYLVAPTKARADVANFQIIQLRK